MRIGNALRVFGKLLNIWKSKNISLPVKVKLYESLVISTLLLWRWVVATTSLTDETRKLSYREDDRAHCMIRVLW